MQVSNCLVKKLCDHWIAAISIIPATIATTIPTTSSNM